MAVRSCSRAEGACHAAAAPNYIHLISSGEFHLGYNKERLQGVCWYHLLHPEHIKEAQAKHKLSTCHLVQSKQKHSSRAPAVTQSDQERSCILLTRYQTQAGGWIWAHCVMQVRENMEGSQDPVIVLTNQVLRYVRAADRAPSCLYQSRYRRAVLPGPVPIEPALNVERLISPSAMNAAAVDS